MELSTVFVGMADLVFSEAVSLAITTMVSKKITEKREAIIAELANGNASYDIIMKDDFLSAIYNMHIAIVQGVGIENIRLLAKILRGLEGTKTTYADKFLRYAQVLSSLSREEIIILAKFAEHYEDISAQRHERIDLEDQNSPISEKVFNDLKHQFDKNSFFGLCGALSRTGLIIPTSGWGVITYTPTPQLQELTSILDSKIDSCLKT